MGYPGAKMAPEVADGSHGGLGCVQEVENDLKAEYFF